MLDQREDWGAERKLLNRWAIWCLHGDSNEMMRSCGLTWAGSPPSAMRDIYDRGAETEDDTTGYARELPPVPDYTSHAVDEFMSALAPILPAVHRALLARHARIVDGRRIWVRSESWIAQSLYGMQRSGAWRRLATDCMTGYGGLRRWLEKSASQSGNDLLVCAGR